MQTGNPRLHALMGEEARHAEDLSPAGDAAVRAQLRFVAEALAANAGPGQAGALQQLSDGLPDRLDAAGPRLAEIEELLADAHAFEAGKQFGAVAEDDPGLAVTLERRIRVDAWLRWFLEGLDEALPGRDVAASATGWLAANQVRLADTIFAMDRAAKRAEMARGGPDAVANPDVVNRIGQAAMLQGHVRMLVEAIALSL
ncbi:MAG: hypothetical protein U0237_19385 [Thermoleophilia bacterium]